MNKILVTGSSGFIGVNLINYLNDFFYSLLLFSREAGFSYNTIDSNYLNKEGITTIIHLAGKAHDLKNVTNEQEYFKVNTELTINLYNDFLKSNSKIFIYFSSVKAVKDHFDNILTEDVKPDPTTAYGKSKLAAENYIMSNLATTSKRVYILRPCLIHGPENKGNLNLLYKTVCKGFPWPLGEFKNKRSFCSIDNLCFIINELINNDQIPSGIYNIADDEPLSTIEIIKLISEKLRKKPLILNIPKLIINTFFKCGDFLRLPLNTDRLNKLTETYIVSNQKIRQAIDKPLPVTSKDGLIKTFNSFNNA